MPNGADRTTVWAGRRYHLGAAWIVAVGATLLMLGASATPQGPAPYRNASLPIDARVRDLLSRMTLEEKFWQLFMTPGDLSDGREKYAHGIFGIQLRREVTARDSSSLSRSEIAAVLRRRANETQHFFVDQTRLGIPAIFFEEAVHGLVQEGAVVYPQAIALAATWDTLLVRRMATAVTLEARARGVRQVLSPVVNIASDVRWGRVEETYGEDPLLASAMAVTFVQPFERAGIVTTPKHFVSNVGDGGRDSYPIQYNQRLLEENFYPPFRAAIEQGGSRSVMSAYNSVDGDPATQSRALLTETLKRRWGFRGFVISDAAATGGATVLHMTEPNTPVAAKHAFEAGLDVVFQSTVDQYRPYWDAIQRGLIAVPVIDSAVARVLRVKFALGLFEHPYADSGETTASPGTRDTALALEASRKSIVLLKNAGGILPLTRDIRSLTVIGLDATEARLGGYTAPNARAVSILQAIREKVAPSVRVSYAPGPGRDAREVTIIPANRLQHDSSGVVAAGLLGEYFDNVRLEGEPRLRRTDATINFSWTLSGPARGLARDWYSVRWKGQLTAPTSETVRIGVEGNDGYRLWIGDTLVIDRSQPRSFGTTLVPLPLVAGRAYPIRLEYSESTGPGHVRLVWDYGVRHDWRASIDSALRLARSTDASVIVAGVEEGEFRDRASLKLPGHQEELIDVLTRSGKPTIVVLVGGSAITMSGWFDRVGAVLDAWYPGEQGGRAMAEVLFGETNPAGRLPITFPLAEGQLPLVYNHKPTGRGDDYVDLTGQPLFPFGYGLSYSRFAYSALSITPERIGPRDVATVRCQVKNVSEVAGDEVVQLYLRDVLASVAQPVIALKGFARIHLEPGEEREVSFRLGPNELSLLDRALQRVVEPGEFRVLVGASSRDIRLRGTLTVQ